MRSSTASSTPRTALPSTAKPCANNRKTPPSAENLTTIPPSEPLKWSTGAAVRDHRNAVRDRSERCPQSIGITVRIRWNPQPAVEDGRCERLGRLSIAQASKRSNPTEGHQHPVTQAEQHPSVAISHQTNRTISTRDRQH